MKPIKITAELLITPDDYNKWCDAYFKHPSPFTRWEITYEHYVYRMLYDKFGRWKDIGGYDDFINTTIEDNGNGLKLTIEELQ